MDNTNRRVSKRGREITESYFQFLDKHIADVITGYATCFMEINQVAGALFVSHKHLTDTIQKETGYHPCYFYDLRIVNTAKEMLLETDLSVSDIAGILTYDPSNFSKFFKKFTGRLPGQFRRESRK